MTTRSLTQSVVALLALLVMVTAARAADPGLALAPNETSDDRAGSMLFFNIYTSAPSNPALQNTRMSITNTNDSVGAFVHLFFVEGSSCSIADRYICLSRSQTTTLLASEQDPGTTGYLVAIEVNDDGTPGFFNYLIGDESVKFETGHFASLGAEAYVKLNGTNVISTDGTLAALFFDGLTLAGSYSRAARVLAVDNIQSRADGNDTLLILNRVGGNLATGASSLGPLFGILYDDAEQAHSFTVVGGCQLRAPLTDTVPKTVPRFGVVIPAGQTGWMKLYSPGDIGISGCVINRNSTVSAGAFNEGHNLHRLKLAAGANYIIPVFEPVC